MCADRANGARHAASVDAAADVLAELAERDVPIGVMTTYRVGGSADLFVRPRTRDDLGVIAAAHQASDLPILIIGRGSNLLISDSGFRGIAVSPIEMTDTIEILAERAQVIAGSGVLLPVLARRCAAASLDGFEWAVGVPGSVGGAVRMNAGGHGSDLAASLVSVTMVDLAAGGASAGRIEGCHRTDSTGVHTLAAEALGLRFRGSDLSQTQLILDVTLQLAPGDRGASEREISEIVQWRRVNQPGGQNAGSVFVNPIPGEVTSGALIDSVGLRGFRRGTATVSEKHANFIQADDGGSADDVRDLMRLVRSRVETATGHRLHSEIRLIGFEDEF